MKCVTCEICGRKLDRHKGVKLCVPVKVGTFDGASQYCWCLCDKCRYEFTKKSHRVLEMQVDI